VLVVAVALGYSQDRTVVNSAKAKQMLLGRHKLSLQWISWDYFGKVAVTERKGLLYLKGRQDGRGSDDFVSIDGVITEVGEKQFVFNGTVITQVSHIFGGEPCKREGELTFKITGKRKYWRMQQIDNPCDEAADYVDIYFR
jgi:hypothetical protein